MYVILMLSLFAGIGSAGSDGCGPVLLHLHRSPPVCGVGSHAVALAIVKQPNQ